MMYQKRVYEVFCWIAVVIMAPSVLSLFLLRYAVNHVMYQKRVFEVFGWIAVVDMLPYLLVLFFLVYNL